MKTSKFAVRKSIQEEYIVYKMSRNVRKRTFGQITNEHLVRHYQVDNK